MIYTFEFLHKRWAVKRTIVIDAPAYHLARHLAALQLMHQGEARNSPEGWFLIAVTSTPPDPKIPAFPV